MALPPGIELTDFTLGPLADFGKQVIRTPVTKTEDNITGREKLAFGIGVPIQAVADRAQKPWQFDNAGKLEEGGDAYIMVEPSVTLNEQDYITFDGVSYEVRSLVTISPGGTPLFKHGNLFIKH